MRPKRKRARRTPPPPSASAAGAISSVLGNGDLLREILLRLDFPTCLVRAAAVSKWWLRQASDPAFLRRFRDLHPPHPLGFYLRTGSGFFQRSRFVPMPQQPPELAAVIRRGRFNLAGDAAFAVSDCRNGRLIVLSRGRYSIRTPLLPARGAAAVPELYKFTGPSYRPLLPEGAGDRTVVALVRSNRSSWVHVSDSEAGGWGKSRASHLIQLPEVWRVCTFGLLANGKLYMIRRVGYILGIDLASRSLFHIDLPHGVGYESKVNFDLSCAQGSGFYLINVDATHIYVWLHSTGCSNGNWELVDYICLYQVFGDLSRSNWLLHGVAVRVTAVGDNADFVFLQIEHEVFYMHIRSRVVKKVHHLQEYEILDLDIHPFMMVWPPTFPQLNGAHDQAAD